jgi:hypothetical protein
MALKDQVTRGFTPGSQPWNYRLAFVAVPLSPEAITLADANIVGMRVLNTTGAALNFTYLAGDGTTFTVSVEPGQPFGDDTAWGVPAIGGFSISASGAGLKFSAARY